MMTIHNFFFMKLMKRKFHPLEILCMSFPELSEINHLNVKTNFAKTK